MTSSEISRTCRLGVLTLALLAAGAADSAPTAADQKTPYTEINAAAATSPITVIRLRDGLSVLEGSGGNIGVLTGRDGLLMVDAGIAVSEHKVQAALRSLQPGPIAYLINTHWHWDHTDGNGWAHRQGARIIAHANTAKLLGQTIRIDEWGHTFTPVPAGYRPTILVTSGKTLKFDGEEAVIRHYRPAHTDGDLSVYFPKADVLFTGDTLWNGLYPFIDHETGGSINGMIEAANANIAMVGEHTIVVPGHGPVGGRADLVAFRDLLTAVRDRVAEMKRRGLTVEQVIAAKPTASFDAKWGQNVITPAMFTALVYRGV